MTNCPILYRTKASKGHLVAFPICDSWWWGQEWLFCLPFSPSSIQFTLPSHWLGTSLHLCSRSLHSLPQGACVLPALAPSNEERELSLLQPHPEMFAHETNNPLGIQTKVSLAQPWTSLSSETMMQLPLSQQLSWVKYPALRASPVSSCPIWLCWRMKPGILWCTSKEPRTIKICLSVLKL